MQKYSVIEILEKNINSLLKFLIFLNEMFKISIYVQEFLM